MGVRQPGGMLLVAVVGMGLGLASCGEAGPGSSDGPASPAAASATEQPGPPPDDATLAVYEQRADWRGASTEAYEEAVDGQGLAEGDFVRTDTQGFAEITYVDGSLTRLDVDTLVEVRRLAGSVRAPDVELRLDVGRVWNHLRDDEETVYVLRTQVATATVRGTTFIVSCPVPTSCTFIVLEGTVEISRPDDGAVLATLNDGQGLVVSSETADGPAGDSGELRAAEDAAAVTAAAADPWVQRNAELDEVELLTEDAAAADGVSVSGVLAWLPSDDTGWLLGLRADDGTFYCLRGSEAFTVEDGTWTRIADGQAVVDMPQPPAEDGELVVGTQRVFVSGAVEPGACGQAADVRIAPDELRAE